MWPPVEMRSSRFLSSKGGSDTRHGLRSCASHPRVGSAMFLGSVGERQEVQASTAGVRYSLQAGDAASQRLRFLIPRVLGSDSFSSFRQGDRIMILEYFAICNSWNILSLRCCCALQMLAQLLIVISADLRGLSLAVCLLFVQLQRILGYRAGQSGLPSVATVCATKFTWTAAICELCSARGGTHEDLCHCPC